jgi:hypothetical protein
MSPLLLESMPPIDMAQVKENQSLAVMVVMLNRTGVEYKETNRENLHSRIPVVDS